MSMRYLSPLRYPGGKAKLGPYFARLLSHQSVDIRTYAEPYAGGVGAGLYLLNQGHIDRLLINDLNPGIAAFWRSIFAHSGTLCAMISDTRLDIDTWHAQREIYLGGSNASSDVALAFATFYLNRCNRSGILTARPIGGLDQSGKWKIDARFNRTELIQRIQRIADMGECISVSQKNALEFIRNLSRRKSAIFMYVDPPYMAQGEELYMREHSWADHESLSAILREARHPWLLTYDTDERVRSLYPSNRCLSYQLSHTAQRQRVGREVMLFSRGLRVPDLWVTSRRVGEWV